MEKVSMFNNSAWAFGKLFSVAIPFCLGKSFYLLLNLTGFDWINEGTAFFVALISTSVGFLYFFFEKSYEARKKWNKKRNFMCLFCFLRAVFGFIGSIMTIIAAFIFLIRNNFSNLQLMYWDSWNTMWFVVIIAPYVLLFFECVFTLGIDIYYRCFNKLIRKKQF